MKKWTFLAAVVEKSWLQMTEVPFLGTIPIDPQVRIGGDNGMPVALSHPDSAVTKALIDITEKIAAQISMAAINKKKTSK